MNLHIRVMTHAIPDSIGIALPAMEVLAVEKPVLVIDGLFKTYPGITVRTVDVSNLLFFHVQLGSFLAFLGFVHG
jgi:hypothetical protein